MTDKTEITPELQALIEQAVEAATAGLKTKRDELLDENRKLKAAKKDAEDKADSAATEAAEKNGDIDSLNKQHEKALKAIADERDAANKQLKTLLVDNAISKALVDGNVPAHFHAPLSAMFRSNTEIEDGKAMREGVELLDSVKTFLSGDAGKHYVMAPMNSGAGATGSTATGSADWANPPKTAEEFQKFGKLANTDPVRANALADKWNMPDLKV